MIGKASVSVLQEYCAKYKFPAPVFDYVDSPDGSFICRVELMDMEAHGNGRSKRDAKHQAAANVIKKLRLAYPNIDEIPQMPQEESPTSDMIVALRDYCIQHDHPLPTIEIIQQAGTPNAPEFTAVCQIATIRRYGVSEKKKDARQKAALEMLRVIYTDDKRDFHMQVVPLAVPLENKVEVMEEERYRKFKSYRELTESLTGEVSGILLCNRHNFFTKFYDELKAEAFDIIKNATSYETVQAQANDLFDALKIKPKITPLPTAKTAERMIYIELNCEYDVVFAGLESDVYQKVVEYFKDML